jgi:hypothetical protein
MTSERQILLTLAAAQRILFRGNVNTEERDTARICEKLTYLFENLYLSQDMKDYLHWHGVTLDSAEVMQLIAEATSAADTAVNVIPRK